jgi:hypothetical protein
VVNTGASAEITATVMDRHNLRRRFQQRYAGHGADDAMIEDLSISAVGGKL